MANKIILKKSSVAAKAPVAGDLDFGELAINYTDSKLYFKKADGSIDAFSSAAAAVTSVAGNSGDVTATQLLTAIKTVDGSGSGLDADTLDGNNSSAFYLATNPSGYTSNAGTVTSVGATTPLVSSGGVTPSISIPAANSTTNGYMSSAYAGKLDGIAAGAQVNVATNLGITAGTTAGPIITSSTGTNATLPTASATASGVVTTSTQTFAGAKTFSSNIVGSITGNAATATTATNQSGGSVNATAATIAGTFHTSWNASQTDIDSLIGGSTGGALIEGAVNGHLTIGLRSNDGGDGFQVISKESGNATYTLKCFEVLANGNASIAGTLTAPTFNATSTTGGGFQGIDVDTASAPSFTWTSDLDTGVFSPTANTLGVTTGGTERMRIDSAGDIVIGKTIANSRLNVNAGDNVTTTYPFRVDNSANNYGVGIGAYGMSNRVNAANLSVDYTFDIGGDAIFKTANAERMRITPVGYVGIGTNSPATNLHVTGTATLATTIFGSGIIELGTNGTGDRNSFIDFHSSGLPGAIDYSARIIRSPSVNGNLDISSNGTGPIRFLNNGAERVSIDGTGNVGIGTATPTDKLSVSGTLGVTGEATVGSLTIADSDDSIVADSSISSWTYDKDFSVAVQDTEPRDLSFSSDGTKMYILGNSGNDINQYTLSTAWDVSTAVYLQVFSVSAQEVTPLGLYFKPDGTKFYMCGGTVDTVYEYNVATAWNISTSTFLQSFSVNAKETEPNAVAFSSDGTKMYVTGTTSDAVHQYNLGTAWSIVTAVFASTFSVSAYAAAPQGLDFDSTGTKMYIVGSTYNRITEFALSTAWTLSTATFSGTVNAILLGNYLTNGLSGIHVEAAQNKAYITDYGTDRVFQISTDIPATRFTGSKFLMDGDLHLEKDLLVYNNLHSNNTIYARSNIVSYGNASVAGILDVRGAIDLADNDILRLGSSDDWEMYHNGVDNYIDLTNGNLIIRDDGTAGDPTRLSLGRTTGDLFVSGNVGIGTSSPSGKFEVSGGRSWFTANSEAYSIAMRYSPSTGVMYMGATNSVGAPSIQFSNSGGAALATIDYSGNVGIGITTPAQKLSVAGVIESTTGGVKFPDGTTQTTAASGGGDFLPLAGGTMTGLLIGRSSTGTDVNVNNDGGSFSVRGGSTTVASISFHRTGAYAINMGLGVDNVFRIGGWSAAVNCFQMTGSGTLTMAGNITANSDERLKKDWLPVSNTFVEDLAKVKTGTYTRTDTSERQAGSSAQDWQKLLPEVVIKASDEEGTLSLAYGNAALVSSVELAKRVIELEERIVRLEKLLTNS